MNWKFTDATNRVVARTNDDGSVESCLVSTIRGWIDAGNSPDPAEPADLNATIQAEIDEIERQTLMNRGCREAWIALIQQQGAAQGLTAAQLYAGNIFYRKLIDTDNEIRSLRSQMT